jgi:hypothetical protein
MLTATPNDTATFVKIECGLDFLISGPAGLTSQADYCELNREGLLTLEQGRSAVLAAAALEMYVRR